MGSYLKLIFHTLERKSDLMVQKLLTVNRCGQSNQLAIQLDFAKK
jgi:hypothetical protein